MTANGYTNTIRSTGVGMESLTHKVNIPGTDQTFESIFTFVNKPKYIYPLHEGKPGTPSDPSLFNVFEYLK